MNTMKITRFLELSFACEEAVNTLCTNLSFSGENVHVIMLTSCHASEGKSFLSMNIMRTMAKLGKTVALVDADLRRSVIVGKYGLHYDGPNGKKGLSHYLAGMATMEDVVYETNLPGAYFVPIGREVSNALPLLNSPRFKQLLNFLRSRVDYVFVDAPPVGTVIDGAQIAKSCDGTLIVVNYNSVRRPELVEVKEQLEQTGTPILGAVLNMVEFDQYVSKKYYYRSYYYKSHYGYYYGDGKSRRSEKSARGKQ